MNQYSADERFSIHEEYGEEVWGWILRQPDSDLPAPDNRWHLWRLCSPYGWCHVTIVESTDPEYLLLLSRRLHKQAMISDTYGMKEYTKMNMEEKAEFDLARQRHAEQLYNDVQKENEWLLKKSMEEMERGNIKPTNPTKDVIHSYSGQTNRSRIVRPLSDTEGGLVLPDEWRED